jgi:hypothetical protein
MTLLLTKDLIAVAIITLLVAIAAMSERQPKRAFGPKRRCEDAMPGYIT